MTYSGEFAALFLVRLSDECVWGRINKYAIGSNFHLIDLKKSKQTENERFLFDYLF